MSALEVEGMVRPSSRSGWQARTQKDNTVPRTIEEGFDDFRKRLTPSSVESEAAKSHRNSIKTRLEQDFSYLKRFTRIGSFGNGTSVSGFSDVDYLACLPTSVLTTSSTYSLQKVRDSLAARFPYTDVHVDCPAVVCPFGTSAAETTEVVPADYVGESSGYKVYDIADRSGGWMRASPDAHNDYVSSQDTRLNGRVKPLIRFIKAWKFARAVPISSFYLELRVAKYASAEKVIVFDIDVKNILCQLRDCSLANLQDPTGVGGYIPACRTPVQRVDALSKLNNAATRAEKARDATRLSRISDAFDWWRLVYDDWFPTYYYS
jgi:hypothetical protein